MEPDAVARQARWAVGTLFLVNGAMIANVVPRWPDLVDALGLSRTAFGAAVAAYGLGALVLGTAAAPLVHRLGSSRVALGAVVAGAVNLVLVGTAGGWAVLATALLLAGAADAVADVAENTHGLRVERLLGRSVLNGMHAMWSIGAVLGGLTGSVAAALRLPVAWHLGVVALALVVIGLAACRRLLPGPDRLDGDVAAESTTAGHHGGHAVHVEGADPCAPRSPSRLRQALPVVLVLGTVAAMAQLMEEASATWSALYLRDELAAGAGAAGLGFVALQGLQIVGRLLGDPAVNRWGDTRVARGGAGLALVAMGAALLLGDAAGIAGNVVAFAAVGLGIGTVIPSAMRRADELTGLRPGTGLTLASTMLRLVTMLAPLALGFVADEYGVRAALVAIPGAAAVVLVLGGTLRPPPQQPRSGSRLAREPAPGDP